ncbi:cupin domain-containing protein [Bacillus licheniformis]|nr:cupin domain-containing protein [Bacillus licheniformis]
MAGEENTRHFRISVRPEKKFEIFYIELAPGCVHESEPHHGGIEEYVLVSKGALAVTAGDYTCDLNEGDAMHFTANTVHTYKTTRNKRHHAIHSFIIRKEVSRWKAGFTQLSRRASFRGFPCRRLHPGRLDIRAFGKTTGCRF